MRIERNGELLGRENPEGSNLQVYNVLQIKVARRFFPNEKTNNEIMEKWTSGNGGESLSSCFRKIIEERPDLLQKYQSNPEEAISDMIDIMDRKSNLDHAV